jgi:hypothetical protein
MAIPSSGQIAASALISELNRTISSGAFSIDTAENGGYGTINTNSRARPLSANPAAFSEWYGYDHDAGGGVGPGRYGELMAGYSNRGSSGQAGPLESCAGNDQARIFWEDPDRNWWTVSVYRGTNFNVFAVPGWYSDQPYGEGFTVRYWTGNSWYTSPSLCTI